MTGPGGACWGFYPQIANFFPTGIQTSPGSSSQGCSPGYWSALGKASTAATLISEKTSWSQDCYDTLAKVGTSPVALQAAAQNVHFEDGTASSALQSSLYKGDAALAGRSVDPNLTFAQLFANSDTTTAEADLNGNRVFIRPAYFNWIDSGAALGTVAHELLHNITGMGDDTLQDKLGVNVGKDTRNISWNLLAHCFN